jgi:hypothetical protein
MEYPWRTWRRWVNILILFAFMSANISAKVFGLAEFMAEFKCLISVDFLDVRQVRQGIWGWDTILLAGVSLWHLPFCRLKS